MSQRVDQRGAAAQGDVVARDKIETHYHGSPRTIGIVEQLLDKLKDEMEHNEKVRDTIDTLKHFYSQHSHDGVVGLQAKLAAGGRADEYMSAIEKKELFAKLLDKWSLYASAQEIFAYLLAKADYEFNYFIYPQIPKIGDIEVNQLVNDKIIAPTVEECGASVFMVNHAVAMGMVYWLAEQCFIRWHH